MCKSGQRMALCFKPEEHSLNKGIYMVAKTKEVVMPVSTTSEQLPDLGEVGKNLWDQLSETATNGVITIEKFLEAEYNVRQLPEIVAKTIHKKARLIYIQYCERLIHELKESAAERNNNF